MCVLVFARYGDTRLGAAALVRQIPSNPLVVACALGIAMQAGGIVPRGRRAGRARARRRVDAAGLLCVGAALRFDAARHGCSRCASRRRSFMAMPLITPPPAACSGLGDAALTVALLFQALPTSSASYIMARQLGGDAPLMAGITAFQTVAAALAMPVVLSALASAPGFR